MVHGCSPPFRVHLHQTALRDTFLVSLLRRMARELKALRDRASEGEARSIRPTFASAIRMTTLLPNTLAARVMVSSETDTFRGSSRRSSCERLVRSSLAIACFVF